MFTFRSDTSLKEWLPVCSLGFAGFIFVTTELMPIGLLPSIASDIGKTESFTGLLITFYAWSVALASLPLTILTEKIDRRKLLFGILGLFTLSHFAAAFATGFYSLLATRVCIAMAHAVFWSITTPLAARLAPEGKKARSLTIVVTGTSLSTILGVPLGTKMGQFFGWRVSFVCIGLIALLILLVLYKLLPSLPSENTNNVKSLPHLLKNKLLIKIYCLTFVVVSGHFIVFSYLVPFYEQVAFLAPANMSYVLLLMGLSGIIGSVIVGKFAESLPLQSIIVCLSLMALSVVFLKPFAEHLYALVSVNMVWGIAMAGFALVAQLFVLRLAENSADIAISIYSGIFNVGIGTGAFVGGGVITFVGLPFIGYAGAILFILALIFCLYLRKVLQRTPA